MNHIVAVVVVDHWISDFIVNGRETKLVFEYVAYVPALRDNLICARMIADKGYKIVITANGSRILKCDNILAVTDTRYHLDWIVLKMVS